MVEFTKDALTEMLGELKAFLIDLDKVLPNRVDADLVGFIDGTLANSWQLQLLYQNLQALKHPARR